MRIKLEAFVWHRTRFHSVEGRHANFLDDYVVLDIGFKRVAEAKTSYMNHAFTWCLGSNYIIVAWCLSTLRAAFTVGKEAEVTFPCSLGVVPSQIGS